MNDDNNRHGGGGGGGFIKKPGKGWLHSDTSIQEGISYNVKYIGCIGVNESMKSLSFEIRTQVARESIRRVAEAAKLVNLPRRNRKNEDIQITSILSTNCNTQWSGMNVQLQINTQYLKVTQLECHEILFQHTMQNISFACGGDADIQDFVAYVAKDEVNGRACYVFECIGNLANNVITTIGQAFELRFRKFLSSMPPMGNKTNSPPQAATNGNHDHNQMQPKKFAPVLEQQQQNNNHVNTNAFNNHNQNNFVHHNNQNHNTNNHNHHHHQQQQQQQQTVHHNNHQTRPSTNENGTNKIANRIDDKLDRMHWFHGLLTRENAEKLLVKDGDYLVRETNKVERQYVLSGRYKGECRHIFLVDPSGVVRTKDRVFDNINHLIQYHQDNNIPIISKDNELLLVNPIHK